MAGNVSRDFEQTNGHKILDLPYAVQVLWAFWIIMPLFWFYRRDNNKFNETLAGTDDIFLSDNFGEEKTKRKAKFDPQGFYSWTVALMFVGENAARFSESPIESAWIQVAIFYGIPVVVAAVLAFFPLLKKRVAICKHPMRNTNLKEFCY